MHAGKLPVIATALVFGAVANYGYSVLSETFALPVRVEFLIIVYCLLLMLLSAGMAEAAGLGIIAAAVSILSRPDYAGMILNGQVMTQGFSMALFNLASEPMGAVFCIISFGYLARKIGAVAPLVTAFLTTLASGITYLLMVHLFNQGLIVSSPGWTGDFLSLVIQVAVVNALVVQVLFMVLSTPARAALQEKTG